MLESIEDRLQDVESAFKLARKSPDESDERRHWVRYLCVLVSATLQSAIQSILKEHVRATGIPVSVRRFVWKQLDRTRNPSRDEIIRIHDQFDGEWGESIKKFIVDEKAAAITSVVSNRNTVSHGGTCNATIRDLSNWFSEVKQVIGFCHDLVLGESRTNNDS